MDVLLRSVVGDRAVLVAATDRADGDFHPGRVAPDLLRSRQLRVTATPWTMLDQVHGTAVYRVPGQNGNVTPAWPLADQGDILVAADGTRPLAIWAADCAPVMLFGSKGAVVAVHAGWRGLAAGVLDTALDEFEARDEQVAVGALGPSIHRCCYEFGEQDLARFASDVDLDHEAIAGRNDSGHLVLDVPATVTEILRRRGVELDAIGGCTGCESHWFSHRVGGELARHAVVAWTETR